jgi:hypothetical protein
VYGERGGCHFAVSAFDVPEAGDCSPDVDRITYTGRRFTSWKMYPR